MRQLRTIVRGEDAADGNSNHFSGYGFLADDLRPHESFKGVVNCYGQKAQQVLVAGAPNRRSAAGSIGARFRDHAPSASWALRIVTPDA
jgi:hypothetical protein